MILFNLDIICCIPRTSYNKLWVNKSQRQRKWIKIYIQILNIHVYIYKHIHKWKILMLPGCWTTIHRSRITETGFCNTICISRFLIGEVCSKSSNAFSCPSSFSMTFFGSPIIKMVTFFSSSSTSTDFTPRIIRYPSNLPWHPWHSQWIFILIT